MPKAAHRFNNALRYRDPSDPRQVQYTPRWLVEAIRDRCFGGLIDVDPCTTVENPVGAAKFFTEAEDGLSQIWAFGGATIFVNPPYGRAREPWVKRCIDEAKFNRVVLLMPAHPDTACFQYAAAEATSVLFLKGRLKFGVLRENRRQAAASHPSSLFGFRVDLRPLAEFGLLMKAEAA